MDHLKCRLVLNPYLKTEYFEASHWEDKWKALGVSLTKDIYDKYKDDLGTREEASPSPKRKSPSNCSPASLIDERVLARMYKAAELKRKKTQDKTELSDFLDEPIISPNETTPKDSKVDMLDHWKVHNVVAKFPAN
jgi:hypothetical protein